MADDLLTRFCINEIQRLKTLAHTDSSILQAIAEHSPGQAPSLYSDELAEAIADATGIDFDTVNAVVDDVWPLAMVQRRMELDNEAFLGCIQERLETEEEIQWSDDDMSRWLAVRPYVTRLLSEESSIVFSVKAIELLLEQPLLLCKSRIVTDMRPIFDEAASQLKGMLAFHTLILRCHEGTSVVNKEIYVALDASDLAILREQIMRAEQKERHMRKAMHSAEIKVVDTGLEEVEGDTNGL